MVDYAFGKMEFPDLGEHCSLSTCKQLDFLPFTCDACKNIFCKDHLKYDEHQCAFAQNKDRRVPVCPLCNQPISVSATDSVDQKVNEHIENYCKSDLAKHKRSNRCKVKGCKQHMLVPVLCASCKQNYCLRHRHEDDHNCVTQNKSPEHRYNPSSASIRAGQEAAKRNVTKNTSTRPKPPQTSVLSSIGSDLNRSRNERLQSPGTYPAAPTRASYNTNNPNNNMSEDQALAQALALSLNETTFTPAETSAPVKPLTRQEKEDMELARALQESEKEERERNRQRERQDSSSSSKKDTCVIS